MKQEWENKIKNNLKAKQETQKPHRAIFYGVRKGVLEISNHHAPQSKGWMDGWTWGCMLMDKHSQIINLMHVTWHGPKGLSPLIWWVVEDLIALGVFLGFTHWDKKGVGVMRWN
jgi:hypothetical protein